MERRVPAVFKGGSTQGECKDCKGFIRVKRLLEAAEDKEREQREKLRDARMEISNRDRQLEVSRRMLARLGAEKTQLETALEEHRTANRRLDQRLQNSQDGEGLQRALKHAKAQMAELKEILHDTESRLMLTEETSINQAREVHVLKGALGFKNEMPDGALDSQAKLLHALAKSQEESTELAVALAGREGALAEGAAALGTARDEIDRLLGLRLELKGQCEELQSALHEVVDRGAAYRHKAENAHHELAEERQHLGEALSSAARTEALLRSSEAALGAQQERGRQLTEKLATVERVSRLSVEALRIEVAVAEERAEARSEEERATATAREASLGEHLTSLHAQLEASEAASVAAAAEHEIALALLRAQAVRLKGDLEDSRALERERLREVSQLQGQLAQLKEHAATLKAELLGAERCSMAAAAEVHEARGELGDERKAQAQLRAHVEAVDVQLRGTLAEGETRQGMLQNQVAMMRTELSASGLVAAQLQQELQAARTKANHAAAKFVDSDLHVEDLHATIHQITESKALLQSTMLEQLGAFREKLGVVEEENRQLRSALSSQQQSRAPPTSGNGRGVSYPSGLPSTLQSALRANIALRSPSSVPSPPHGVRAAGGGYGDSTALLGRARLASRALGLEASSEEDEDEESPSEIARRTHKSGRPSGSVLSRGALGALVSGLATGGGGGARR